jgi:AAA domain
VVHGRFTPNETWDPHDPEARGDAHEPEVDHGPTNGRPHAPPYTPPPPPKEESSSQPRWPDPVYVSELSTAGTDIEFLWDGCIAREHLTMLSALPKCGKTTLLGHLLRCTQRGEPFAGRATKECRTLIVSEESTGMWIRRRDLLGLTDHLSVLCRPMLGKPDFGDWADFIRHVEARAIKRCCDLVAFDTLTAFAPWKSENDSADIYATVTPLNRLTKAGLGVLLVHHIGKSDAGEGRAARGSTALAAAMDVLLELRRHKPEDTDDRRRVLKGLGRFEEVPDELVIRLKEDGTGYASEGDRKALAARELAEAILAALPTGPPGATADVIHGDMDQDIRPARSKVGATLLAGAEAGHWQTAGSGRKGDPRRFWRS